MPEPRDASVAATPDGGVPAGTNPRTGGQALSRVVFDEAVIARRVAEMGKEIGAAYAEGANLLVLGLLKGSFIFLADLVRQIPRPLHVDFLVASSYGARTVTSGEVRLLYDPEARSRAPSSWSRTPRQRDDAEPPVPLLRAGAGEPSLCALHKRVAEDLVLEPRWVGFDAPREFLVGYGLDHAEDYRHLPYIASL